MTRRRALFALNGSAEAQPALIAGQDLEAEATAELVDDWTQGTPLKWIQEICRCWVEAYDWRRREALLNRFAQFTSAIDGLDIHFLHVRSPHPAAMPLIITHGWPGVGGRGSTRR